MTAFNIPNNASRFCFLACLLATGREASRRNKKTEMIAVCEDFFFYVDGDDGDYGGSDDG